jgi:hypothetical protein
MDGSATWISAARDKNEIKIIINQDSSPETDSDLDENVRSPPLLTSDFCFPPHDKEQASCSKEDKKHIITTENLFDPSPPCPVAIAPPLLEENRGKIRERERRGRTTDERIKK